jgi:REP element-mobilizing transposase RayT
MRINVVPGSLGAVVRSYKAAVSRRINACRDRLGAAVWQRGYYERIIRDARELAAVRRYIADNPRRWAAQRESLDVLLAEMCPHTTGR